MELVLRNRGGQQPGHMETIGGTLSRKRTAGKFSNLGLAVFEESSSLILPAPLGRVVASGRALWETDALLP